MARNLEMGPVVVPHCTNCTVQSISTTAVKLNKKRTCFLPYYVHWILNPNLLLSQNWPPLSLRKSTPEIKNIFGWISLQDEMPIEVICGAQAIKGSQ